jgi:hypothetical protein
LQGSELTKAVEFGGLTYLLELLSESLKYFQKKAWKKLDYLATLFIIYTDDT